MSIYHFETKTIHKDRFYSMFSVFLYFAFSSKFLQSFRKKMRTRSHFNKSAEKQQKNSRFSRRKPAIDHLFIRFIW